MERYLIQKAENVSSGFFSEIYLSAVTERMVEMIGRRIITCTQCGRTLAKLCDGSEGEITCPKCKEEYAFEIKENTVVLKAVKQKNTTNNCYRVG